MYCIFLALTRRGPPAGRCHEGGGGAAGGPGSRKASAPAVSTFALYYTLLKLDNRRFLPGTASASKCNFTRNFVAWTCGSAGPGNHRNFLDQDSDAT